MEKILDVLEIHFEKKKNKNKKQKKLLFQKFILPKVFRCLQLSIS